MPRTKLSAERDSLRDLTGEILCQGSRHGYTSYEAMAPALKVSPNTVSRYLKEPEKIRLETLRTMVKILRLDPGIVLAALGYSRADIKSILKGESET